MPNSILKPPQSRAARALLNWTKAELASAAGISLPTLQRFENGTHTPSPASLAAIREALSVFGVDFLADETNEDEEFGLILAAKKSHSSQKKEHLLFNRVMEKSLLLRGTIIQAFASIEFTLNDLCMRCLALKPYK